MRGSSAGAGAGSWHWGEPGVPLRAGRSPAVFVVLSFTSVVDLIISLEEDGFISGFMEVYVREVPPLPVAGSHTRAAPRTQGRLGAAAGSAGEEVREGACPHPV